MASSQQPPTRAMATENSSGRLSNGIPASKLASEYTRPAARGSSASTQLVGAAAAGVPRRESLGGGGGARGARPVAGSLSAATALASGSGRPGSAASRGTPPTAGLAASGARGGGGSLACLQDNALYGAESSMTPSVRKAEYAPTLSPDMEQLARDALASADAVLAAARAPAGTRAATAAATASAGTAATAVDGLAAQLRGAALAQTSKPKHFLSTTGDLFALSDQGDQQQVPLSVDVCGTRLSLPAWNHTRPWLTGAWVMQYPPSFVAEAGGTGTGCLPPPPLLSPLPASEQEAALVDDLLTVFMGQPGAYVTHTLVEGPAWQRVAFAVTGVNDASLAEQVQQLLPLCEAVHVIKRFVETRSRLDQPSVVQALAAALRGLQEEWRLLVVQLENQLLQGQLSLAALIYYCQEPGASLLLLAGIAGEAADGGALTSAGLLNLLAARQRGLAGDRAGAALVGQLLAAAAEPYFGILRQWLCWGVLDDPYHEFMVKEDPGISRDSIMPDGRPAYWHARYRLRGAVTTSHDDGAAGRQQQHDVPEFLESSKDAILVTGKYLNIIRLCEQQVPPAAEETLAKLHFTPLPGSAAQGSGGVSAAAAAAGSPVYLAGVQEALAAAAGALLSLLRGPRVRLLDWLHSLKHAFLLDQGDLVVHLLAQSELHGPPSNLPPHRLQGILEAALRASSVAASPHAEVLLGEGVLSAAVDSRSLLQLVTAATCGSVDGGQQAPLEGGGGLSVLRSAKGSYVSCLEMLLIGVRLEWPLTLLVSKRQQLHYQVIFKHLLSLKWAEHALGRSWGGMRAAKRMGRDDQDRLRPWHLLCNQLQYVVGEVLRFTCIDVLEPLWVTMAEQLRRAESMDEVISLHDAFLSAALERALLTQPQVVRHISVLLTSAHELAKEGAAFNSAVHGSEAGTPAARAGASSGGGSGGGIAPAQQLELMARFCRDAHRQAQQAALAAKAETALQELVGELALHHQQLLSAAPPAGVAVGCGGVGGRRALGDASRELASLHNLMQRLQLGCRDPRGRSNAVWGAAY